MSDEGSPPPVTPSRKRTTRMRTGGRKPLPSVTDRFLDLEAVESGESAEEENLDKYESDFIDDGGDDDRAPISWSRTPSPTPDMPSSKGMAAAGTSPISKIAEPAKQEVASQPQIAPMTTRSRAKNNPTAAGEPKVAANPGSALNLNTTGYKGSEGGFSTARVPNAVIPSVSWRRAFMLFKNSRIASAKSAGGKGSKSLTSGDSSSISSNTLSAGSLPGSNKVANLPAPTWGLIARSVGRERLASPDIPPSEALHTGASSEKIDSKAAGKKPANRGAKRKSTGTDESEHSEPETAVVTSPPLRKPKGHVGVTALSYLRSTPVILVVASCPKVPIAEFERLKEASPAKKPKMEENVLHTVDIKRVQFVFILRYDEFYLILGRALPAVCEVMDVELQDPMMHSIYALDLPKLKRGQVTTWSSNEGSGMFMLSQYPGHQSQFVHSVRLFCKVTGPNSSDLPVSTVWALLLFVRKGHYINPARIDPRVLEARSPVYARDGLRKRWVLSVDARPAVCVSVVNAVQSSVQQISTVYGASNNATPLLKFITGVHLSQDFDRITGLCGMVFDLSLMHVQLNASALTFGTREKLGSPDQKGIKSSSSLYRKQTYTAPTDSLNYDDNIPVYDGRHTGFDASVDIDDLARILPLYTGEIPANSCTAVAYTVSNFVKHYPGRDDEQHLSFNLQWVVVLGEPE
ncbi:hypothetical protein B0H14DRAFT_2580937 [Mycena olivaceomarginata]|nr:hypothetical protein B0H14DRAFT_2580937 [Mycena olivaceomarginata]